jgi:hypothetical protein
MLTGGSNKNSLLYALSLGRGYTAGVGANDVVSVAVEIMLGNSTILKDDSMSVCVSECRM